MNTNLPTGKFTVTNFFNTAIRLAFWCGLIEFSLYALQKYGVLEAFITLMTTN